jgi:hypothetical protein
LFLFLGLFEGLGLVGITAALLGASSVILTDLECQLDILKDNVELNRRFWTASAASNSLVCECDVRVVKHEFGDIQGGATLVQSLDIEVILGSDIGYDVNLLELLSQSLHLFVMSPSFTVALIAEEVRWKDVYEWHKESYQQYISNPGGDKDGHNRGLCPDFDFTEMNITLGNDSKDEDKELSVRLFKCQISTLAAASNMTEIGRDVYVSQDQILVPNIKSKSPIQLLYLAKKFQ